MKIFSRKANIEGVGYELLSFDNYKKKSNSGEFLQLEEEFLAKLDQLSLIDKKKLRHALIHGMRSNEGSITVWVGIGIPFLIGLISSFLAINISLSKFKSENIWANLFELGLLIFPFLLMTIIALLIVSRNFTRRKGEEMFFRFYYDILIEYERDKSSVNEPQSYANQNQS